MTAYEFAADMDAIGWDEDELAHRTGVPARRIRRWYRGDAVPFRIAQWVNKIAEFHRNNPPPAKDDAL